jgi:hypothetical protein
LPSAYQLFGDADDLVSALAFTEHDLRPGGRPMEIDAYRVREGQRALGQSHVDSHLTGWTREGCSSALVI